MVKIISILKCSGGKKKTKANGLSPVIMHLTITSQWPVRWTPRDVSPSSPHSLIHSFILSFIQQICTEHLLCSCQRHWAYSREKQTPYSDEYHILESRSQMISKKIDEQITYPVEISTQQKNRVREIRSMIWPRQEMLLFSMSCGKDFSDGMSFEKVTEEIGEMAVWIFPRTRESVVQGEQWLQRS